MGSGEVWAFGTMYVIISIHAAGRQDILVPMPWSLWGCCWVFPRSDGKATYDGLISYIPAALAPGIFCGS